MWHGRVRTEWRTLSAAPLNLGSGFSRETPALDSFLSDIKETKLTMKRMSHKAFDIQQMHLPNVLHGALSACIHYELTLVGIELQ